MLSVEQHALIRQLFFLDQVSARQIAVRLNVSRNTVKKALDNSTAPTYTLQKPRPQPKLGDFKTLIDGLLLENSRLPRKQRYTSRKIFELLVAKGYSGSYSGVNLYVVQWKKSNKAPKLFLPLAFEPGQDAQVDWYEAKVFLNEVLTTVQVFVMWLAFSRRIFVQAFPAQRQEAFFEGHVNAFEFFGGTPHRISYDNLAAVKVLAHGRIREENRAFTAFRTYYLFESHFCTPGQGHEKGGVEASAGVSRRNFLVPLPHVTSYQELNALLLERCRANDARRVSRQPNTIGELWQQERPLLRPLPAIPFECCVRREVRLNPYSQVTFETNRYSVPVETARPALVLKAYPFRVDILASYSPGISQDAVAAGAGTDPSRSRGAGDGSGKILASHPRCYGSEQDIFDPLHYLGLLEQRPGAFEYARPLAAWRREWPPVYHRAKELLVQKWPDGRGFKEFIQILKLHQNHSSQAVEAALLQTLEWGCLHYDGVLQALQLQLQPMASASGLGRIVNLPAVASNKKTANRAAVEGRYGMQQLSFGELDLSDKPHLAAIRNVPVDLSSYERLLTQSSARSGASSGVAIVLNPAGQEQEKEREVS
jgi:transposase